MNQRRLRTRQCFLSVIALLLAYLATAWFSSPRLEFKTKSPVGIGELQEAAAAIELRLTTFGFKNARVRVHRAGRLRVTYGKGQAISMLFTILLPPNRSRIARDHGAQGLNPV